MGSDLEKGIALAIAPNSIPKAFPGAGRTGLQRLTEARSEAPMASPAPRQETVKGKETDRKRSYETIVDQLLKTTAASERRTIPGSLSGAMIFQFAVGGALMPFVTVLLRDYGLDITQVSYIFLASTSTLLVFPFFWGMLADRFIPLNRLFTILNLLAIAALVAFSLQRTFLGFLITFTAFYACFNPTLSLINPLCFYHLADPRAQFGPLRAWGSLGWIIPSIPIYFWLASAPGQELGFTVYLAIGFCAAMVGLSFFLPHTPPGTTATAPRVEPRIGYGQAVRRLLRDPNYLIILISFFLVAGSFSLLVFYSPPLLEDLGLARRWLGPIQMIGVGLEVALFRWPAAALRRLTYSTTIAMGCLALLLRHVLFAFVDDLWILAASYLLAGAVIVFYHIGASLLVNAMAAAEVRSTAQALLVLFGSGMGPMFANWVSGRIAAAAGQDLRPVFLFAAVLAALASVLVLWRGAKTGCRRKRAKVSRQTFCSP